MVPATIEEMKKQAMKVLMYYKDQVKEGKQKAATTINFNWMARGEPLLNSMLVNRWGFLAREFKNMACYISRMLGVSPIRLKVKFKISTIMPRVNLEMFMTTQTLNTPRDLVPTLYYSLYSTDLGFRRRWLPKAAPVEVALNYLQKFQMNGGKVVLHWAFIRMQNDNAEDIARIGEMIQQYNINARFNTVRYNPFSHQQGMESDEEVIQARFKEMCEFMTVPGSKIIPRVGSDVKASCGQFVPANMIPIQPVAN